VLFKKFNKDFWDEKSGFLGGGLAFTGWSGSIGSSGGSN
jgi:hypothetical protein